MASRFRVFGWLEQTNSSVFTQICGRRLISSKACKRAAMNLFDSGTKGQRKGFFTSSYSADGIQPTIINMPSLSPTMEEGRIKKWLKGEGDKLMAGDELCEIETDKATVTMEADDDCVLAKILVPEGSDLIKIGEQIALTVEEGEDYTKVAIPEKESPPVTQQTESPSVQSLPVSDTSVHSSLLGPSVRHLLESYSLDRQSIQPSGRKGQLLKGDVLKYIDENAKTRKVFKPEVKTEEITISEEKPHTEDTDAEYTDVALSNMRRTIAKRVTESKMTVPHVYTTLDCNLDKVFIMRKKLKEDGIVVSVNDFIIKAAGIALIRVPEVNSYWSEDGPVPLKTVDIGVAVASPNGLITPVINGANELDIPSISSTVRELANRAKEGLLKLHEFQGGSFTISNLGMFGIKNFTAVIYPPQAGILAVGQSQVSFNDDCKPAKIMTVTLCCDGRVVEEKIAATWLNEFQEIIENPLQMGL